MDQPYVILDVSFFPSFYAKIMMSPSAPLYGQSLYLLKESSITRLSIIYNICVLQFVNKSYHLRKFIAFCWKVRLIATPLAIHHAFDFLCLKYRLLNSADSLCQLHILWQSTVKSIILFSRHIYWSCSKLNSHDFYFHIVFSSILGILFHCLKAKVIFFVLKTLSMMDSYDKYSAQHKTTATVLQY